MESHHSKCMESISTPFYNISPIVGSSPPVLASPDTEIAPKTAPNSKKLASTFLHQYMLQTGHKNSVGQPSVCSTAYQKPSPIGGLLHGTECTPSCSLLAQAGHHRNPPCSTNY